jgi:hypothetical protein
MVSTLAGCARILFSEASAAAVTCAIMKPESIPGVFTRKAGRPLIAGSTSSAVRRSDMLPISASASAMPSAAKATGSAWKLPPDRISPSAANTSGLSETAFASATRRAAAERSWSRQAPITCGWQRRQYGSCTRSQSAWLARIALPATRSRRISAAILCPGCPRTRWMRGSKAVSVPRAASSERAPATSAAASRRSVANSPTSASAVDTCVPLMSANPSFGPRRSGFNPASANAVAAGTVRPFRRTSPSPISASDRCARGARSPEAPTEPLPGTTGRISWVAKARSWTIVSGRTPE